MWKAAQHTLPTMTAATLAIVQQQFQLQTMLTTAKRLSILGLAALDSKGCTHPG